MSSASERVVNHWREQGDTFASQFADDMAAHCGPAYARMPRDRVLRTANQIVQLWQDALISGDVARLAEPLHGLVEPAVLVEKVGHLPVGERVRGSEVHRLLVGLDRLLEQGKLFRIVEPLVDVRTGGVYSQLLRFLTIRSERGTFVGAEPLLPRTASRNPIRSVPASRPLERIRPHGETRNSASSGPFS